jgi:hypothetical protein
MTKHLADIAVMIVAGILLFRSGLQLRVKFAGLILIYIVWRVGIFNYFPDWDDLPIPYSFVPWYGQGRNLVGLIVMALVITFLDND